MKSMSTRDKFAAEIEIFLDRTGMPQTQLGLRVLNDHTFVRRLRAGAGVTVETMDKVRAFMEGYRKSGPLARESAAA